MSPIRPGFVVKQEVIEKLNALSVKKGLNVEKNDRRVGLIFYSSLEFWPILLL